MTYIQPLESSHTFVKSGQGYKGESIQHQIEQWDDLGEDRNVAIAIYAPSPSSKGCYLHWNLTWLNIKAEWISNNDNVKHIQALYISSKKHSWAPPELEFSIDELGLFDQKEPNDHLKTFMSKFIDIWHSHKHEYQEQQEQDALESPVQHKIIAKHWMANEKNGCLGFVQFHPSYDYSDFVEGLRPVQQAQGQIGFELKEGIFKQFCRRAAQEVEKAQEEQREAQSYVFIIDEINRGEISKIFGELLFSIDPDYRGAYRPVQTQYQNLIKPDDNDVFADGFYVPENVYIIGTMNDIDRSVESLDFAFRRRFAWYEVKAQDRMDMLSEDKTLKVAGLCDEAKQRLMQLNEPSLGVAYQIGPAYFLKLEHYLEDESPFDSLWQYHLKPLLFEYVRGLGDREELLQKLEAAYNCQSSNEQSD